MNAKFASISLLVVAISTGPTLASDRFAVPPATAQERVATVEAGQPQNPLYKAPYGVSSLMCSPSGFGHVSTCVPKTFANRHQLIEVSTR